MEVRPPKKMYTSRFHKNLPPDETPANDNADNERGRCRTITQLQQQYQNSEESFFIGKRKRESAEYENMESESRPAKQPVHVSAHTGQSPYHSQRYAAPVRNAVMSHPVAAVARNLDTAFNSTLSQWAGDQSGRECVADLSRQYQHSNFRRSEDVRTTQSSSPQIMGRPHAENAQTTGNVLLNDSDKNCVNSPNKNLQDSILLNGLLDKRRPQQLDNPFNLSLRADPSELRHDSSSVYPRHQNVSTPDGDFSTSSHIRVKSTAATYQFVQNNRNDRFPQTSPNERYPETSRHDETYLGHQQREALVEMRGRRWSHGPVDLSGNRAVRNPQNATHQSSRSQSTTDCDLSPNSHFTASCPSRSSDRHQTVNSRVISSNDHRSSIITSLSPSSSSSSQLGIHPPPHSPNRSLHIDHKQTSPVIRSSTQKSTSPHNSLSGELAHLRNPPPLLLSSRELLRQFNSQMHPHPQIHPYTQIHSPPQIHPHAQIHSDPGIHSYERNLYQRDLVSDRHLPSSPRGPAQIFSETSGVCTESSPNPKRSASSSSSPVSGHHGNTASTPMPLYGRGEGGSVYMQQSSFLSHSTSRGILPERLPPTCSSVSNDSQADVHDVDFGMSRMTASSDKPDRHVDSPRFTMERTAAIPANLSRSPETGSHHGSSRSSLSDADLQEYLKKIQEGAMALKELSRLQSQGVIRQDQLYMPEPSLLSISPPAEQLCPQFDRENARDGNMNPKPESISSAVMTSPPPASVSSTNPEQSPHSLTFCKRNHESPKSQSFMDLSSYRSKNNQSVSHCLNDDSEVSVVGSVSHGQSNKVTSTVPVKRQSVDPPVACQVCGDVASGFHCGAFVCEACKKFFLRCLKQDKIKYVCPKNQDCVLTRESRTQCQYCRYKKCMDIGMYKPGTGPDLGVDASVSNIPCKVCGARSSGYHFGAITCEGCKGFFRRTVKERDSCKYTCSRNSNCTITTATRNICKFCRYQKCLQAGMTPEGSRIGRQPNAVKHATFLEIQHLSSQKEEPPEIKEEPPDEITVINLVEPAEPQPADDHNEDKSTIIEAWRNLIHNLSTLPMSTNMTEEDDYIIIWDKMMESFYQKSHAILKFAKKLPGFSTFPIQHQINMIQMSIYQITLLIQTQLLQEYGGQCTWYLFPKENETIIFKHFPEMTRMKMHYSNTVTSTANMQLEETEFALLAAMVILSRDEANFKDVLSILNYQEDVAMMLQEHCLERYPTQLTRFGTLVARLPELFRSNYEHSKIMHEIVNRYPNIHIPQLFFEIFINREKLR